MTKPRSAHKIVSLTLWGVASGCLLAASLVDWLERDKKATATLLAQNGDREIDVETPAAEAAGDLTTE